MITSSSNEKIKKLVSLQTKKGRLEHGLFLIEGEHMVKEAVSSGLSLTEIFVAGSKEAEFKALLKSAVCDITPVSDTVFERFSNTKTSQGIAATMKIPVFEKFDLKSKFLVLDRISDPGNMGTIIRTAVATGFENIICINTVDVFNPKVVRSTSGGIFGQSFGSAKKVSFWQKLEKSGFLSPQLKVRVFLNLKTSQRFLALLLEAKHMVFHKI